MTRIRSLLLAVVLVIPTASGARAEVLSADTAPLLCKDVGNGTRLVDRDVLAHIITTEAGAELYLDGANRLGMRDGAIQLRTGDGVLSEPVYAVMNADVDAGGSNYPFGPNISPDDTRASKARERIVELQADLNLLINQGSKTAGSVVFRVVRREVVGAPRTDEEWRHLSSRLLFEADPPLIILCEHAPAKAPEPGAPSEKKKESAPGWLRARNIIRLRGKVKDLTVGIASVTDLKGIEPAKIGFERDGESDTTTFGVNGVVGLRYPEDTGTFDLIPFFSYEYRAVTANDGDNINKVAPGLLAGYSFERTDVATHAKLEGTWIEEQVTDSTQGKLRAYVDPAFRLAPGWGLLFGSNLKPLGPLQWRPDLTLIFDASHVFDAGASSELAKASNYYGLGGQLSLRLRLDYGKPISDVSVDGGLRGLALFGDIQNDDVRRWYGSIEYSPDEFPYFGIGLSVSRGENDDTFQDEKLYSINTTLRY